MQMHCHLMHQLRLFPSRVFCKKVIVVVLPSRRGSSWCRLHLFSIKLSKSVRHFALVSVLLRLSSRLISISPTDSTILELCCLEALWYACFMCTLNLSNGDEFQSLKHPNPPRSWNTWSNRWNFSIYYIVSHFSSNMASRVRLNFYIYPSISSSCALSLISTLLFLSKELARSE